jgi:hypothetical protein
MTPKERMLRAYRGEFSDRYPVAPEFWYYYPAKILGVPLVELERDIPHWKVLLRAFQKYETEGWGIAFPEFEHSDLNRRVYPLKKIGEGEYRETMELRFRGRVFTEIKRYSLTEPSWVEKKLLDGPDQLEDYLDMTLAKDNLWDTRSLCAAHAEVGDAYLLELYLGLPFFDFIANVMGFEETVFFFMSAEEELLDRYRIRYTEYQLERIRNFSAGTPFESYNIGCSYSCLSLLGPELWRRHDKPYLAAVTEELHHHGKLLHIHFHGRSMAVVEDFAEIGLDCVCPFERGPGGDVNTPTDLARVREALGNKVTFNGNVHTVNTLIFGTSEDARREVAELKEAFTGSPRLIIGTGDQVGADTREDVLLAMIEEAKKP